jgi:hypothetical protein
MNVAEFFDALVFGEDVEVVIARSQKGLSGRCLETERLREPRTVESGWVGGSESRRWTCSGMTT